MLPNPLPLHYPLPAALGPLMSLLEGSFWVWFSPSQLPGRVLGTGTGLPCCSVAAFPDQREGKLFMQSLLVPPGMKGSADCSPAISSLLPISKIKNFPRVLQIYLVFVL